MMHCCVVDVFSSMLCSSLSLFLSYKLVGKEYRVLLHFFFWFFVFWFCFSLLFRITSRLCVIHFSHLASSGESSRHTRLCIVVFAAEDETRETEHWTAIKEPPTLARTLRHLRYL